MLGDATIQIIYDLQGGVNAQVVYADERNVLQFQFMLDWLQGRGTPGFISFPNLISTTSSSAATLPSAGQIGI